MSDSLQPHGLQHASLHCYRYNPYLWCWKLSLCAPVLNWHSKKEFWVKWKRIVSLFCWTKADTEGSVQFRCSVVSDSVILWTAARQAALSMMNSQSLLKLTSIDSVMPSNHLILCRPLLLLPSVFPSIRVFSSGSSLYIRWPKNIQGWFPLGLTDFICSPKDSQESSSTPQFKFCGTQYSW